MEKSEREVFENTVYTEGGGGLYIHIPYCSSKCIYCDFFSGGAGIADWPHFVKGLKREFRMRYSEMPRPLRSIYIGGGTPSLMPTEELTGLLEMIKIGSGEQWAVNEITLEVNPEDVTEQTAEEWADAGINRISMGVQTLNNQELQAIGRRHDATQAYKAMKILREKFSNISVDIMFGLPGQTMETLRETLEGIMQIQPEHISAYSLMYEEGTPLTVLASKGRIPVADEELSLKMYEMISGFLSERGYEQYEISNYAKRGYRSKHNSSYWTGRPYLGLGPSAHSYDGKNIRRWNPSDIKGYIERYGGDTVPGNEEQFYEEELLDTMQKMEEMIMLALRTREGLNMRIFREEFGEEASEKILRRAERLGEVMLRKTEDQISLTKSSLMQSDRIIVELISVL